LSSQAILGVLGRILLPRRYVFGKPDTLTSSAGSTSGTLASLANDFQARIGRAFLYLAQVGTIKPLLRDMLWR
jgi:hypothetical protein